MKEIRLVLIITIVVLSSLASLSLMAAEADLTRHLATHQRTAGPPDVYSDSFFGTVGPATLVLQSENAPKGNVTLNGNLVVGPNELQNVGWLEVPVNLVSDNSIDVTMNGKPGSSLTVRIKQHVDVPVQLVSRVHFNIQVTDFTESRNFYDMLGFTDSQGGFPSTNTYEMAKSLGMYDICTYEFFDANLISIPSGWGSTTIDLIEFITPFNDDPPYPNLNHLGMAHAAFLTTNLASDMAYMQSQGIEFLPGPVGIPGNQFVFFKDLEGTFYKLVETAPPHGDPGANMHITAIPYVNINVSDFERSREFYRMLGFADSVSLPATSTLEEAQAMGLDHPYQIRGEDVSLTNFDQSVLRLIQWIDPSDDEPPYPPPINHIGIDRLAYFVFNVDAAFAALTAQGVKFLSEPAPCCSGTGLDTFGIVSLLDPDGVFVELVGPLTPPLPPPPPPDWCPDPGHPPL